jgi:hypothetical protein
MDYDCLILSSSQSTESYATLGCLRELVVLNEPAKLPNPQQFNNAVKLHDGN